MANFGGICDKFAISRILMKTVNHYNEPKLLARGIHVVERFVQQQPADVDEVLFNSLLDACCRTRDMARLESILAKMRINGIQPSSVTLGILVKAYGQAGDIESVWREWQRMKEALTENANAVTFGCMLDACVKCGDIEKALFVFQDIKRIGKHHNTILYTTLMKGYGMARNLDGAIGLFNEMKAEQVPVNTITFNSMIDVAVRAHDCGKAEELYQELEQTAGIEPDLITYSTLIKGFCQLGDLNKALHYMALLKGRGLYPDELVFNSLLDGCVKANDLSTGLALFDEMKDEAAAGGIGQPSHVTYQILVRLYRRSGYSELETENNVHYLFTSAGIPIPRNVGMRGRGHQGRRQGPRNRQKFLGSSAHPHQQGHQQGQQQGGGGYNSQHHGAGGQHVHGHGGKDGSRSNQATASAPSSSKSSAGNSSSSSNNLQAGHGISGGHHAPRNYTSPVSGSPRYGAVYSQQHEQRQQNLLETRTT
ncbi:unnamed protein product [Amoebophrya sp. A25]|nr:unnamed protein product [Amoebophrya sp. A25]|eukprot:GSA25T00020901001.1